MARIAVIDTRGVVIEYWDNNVESPFNDGIDVEWCIRNQSLGTDLPRDIIHALEEALENEHRYREQAKGGE